MFYGSGGKAVEKAAGGQRTRNERYEQMTKQQDLIEQKKREIETKLEAERHKKAMEAILGKPLTSGAAGPVPVNSPSAKSGSSTSNKSPAVVKSEGGESSKVGASFVFANDGSFMEQFRRLQEQKLKEQETQGKIKIKEEPVDANEYGSISDRKPLIKVMSPHVLQATKITSAPVPPYPSVHPRPLSTQTNTNIPPSTMYGAVPPPPTSTQRQGDHTPIPRPQSFSGNYNSVAPPPPPYPPPASHTSPPGFPSLIVKNFAATVAEKGDQHEDSARVTKNPLLWFLNRPDSEEYRLYRDLVLKLRTEKPHNQQSQNFNSPVANTYDSKSFQEFERTSDVTFKRQAPLMISREEEDEQNGSRKRRSRWGPQEDMKPSIPLTAVSGTIQGVPPPLLNAYPPPLMSMSQPPPPPPPPPVVGGFKQERGQPILNSFLGTGGIPGITVADLKGPSPVLSKVTRTNPQLLEYAKQSYGTVHMDEEQWKQCEEAYKMNLLFQDIARKKAKDEKIALAGKFKHEYDSDEEIDDSGTWEHKQRMKEMEKTKDWALELTSQAKGKHHIGDFLPPEELAKFMDKYKAVKEGKQMTQSAYEDFKIAQDNVGFKLLQKMGWSDGQGLGASGQGITAPIDKGTSGADKQGLGLEQPDDIREDDDEYAAYRKRMMLAYRFRPNPLNNPRRAYY